MPAFKKPFAKMGTDKPRSSCHQNSLFLLHPHTLLYPAKLVEGACLLLLYDVPGISLNVSFLFPEASPEKNCHCPEPNSKRSSHPPQERNSPVSIDYCRHRRDLFDILRRRRFLPDGLLSFFRLHVFIRRRSCRVCIFVHRFCFRNREKLLAFGSNRSDDFFFYRWG